MSDEVFRLCLDTEMSSAGEGSYIQFGSSDDNSSRSYFEVQRLANLIQSSGPKLSTMLPPVVRSFSHNFKHVLIERAPFTTTIRYRPAIYPEVSEDLARQAWSDICDEAHIDKLATQMESEFPISVNIPWTVYDISLDTLHPSGSPTEWFVRNMSIYMRPSQIISDEDPLWPLYFPNVNGSFDPCIEPTVCLDGVIDIDEGHADPVSAVSFAINAFWNSTFNSDMGCDKLSHWPGVSKLDRASKKSDLSLYMTLFPEHLFDLNVDYFDALSAIDSRLRKYFTDLRLLQLLGKLSMHEVLKLKMPGSCTYVCDVLNRYNAAVDPLDNCTDPDSFANYLWNNLSAKPNPAQKEEVPF